MSDYDDKPLWYKEKELTITSSRTVTAEDEAIFKAFEDGLSKPAAPSMKWVVMRQIVIGSEEPLRDGNGDTIYFDHFLHADARRKSLTGIAYVAPKWIYHV
jgi:hypothetical protein